MKFLKFIVVTILIFLGIGLGMGFLFSNVLKGPDDVADRFLEQIRGGAYLEAYDTYMSWDFKARVPRSEFKRYVRESPFRSHLSNKWDTGQVLDGNNSMMFVGSIITRDKNTVPFSVTLILENDDGDLCHQDYSMMAQEGCSFKIQTLNLLP